MNKEIVLQTPFWYIILCLFLGILYSLIFYFREKTFKKKQKLGFALLRGSIVFLIAFLLLNPLIKSLNQLILKPKVLLLLDNSASMNQNSTQNKKVLFDGIAALQDNLKDQGFETNITDLSGNLLDQKLNEKTFFKLNKTNLTESLNKVKNNYEGQNLSDVILISDGIITEGVSPTFQKYDYNIHTVGFGDTTVRKDLAITGISANRIAYFGNIFTVSIDVSSSLLAGKTSNISLKNSNGQTIANQNINIVKAEDFKTINFEIKAEKLGKQRYIVQASSIDGESTLKNNYKDFVIDVVNGKEKILLLAFAPHPDIKALKSIIDKSDLFEIETQILQSTEPSLIAKNPFDLVIFHNLPDAFGSSTPIVSRILSQKKPVFYFIGPKTNIQVFNGVQQVLGINSQINKIDKTKAIINSNFQRFSLNSEAQSLFEKLPPVSVPFGEYKSYPGVETPLNQVIGNVNTGRPLLSLNLTKETKQAVFTGEGLWQWRLEEYAISEQHKHVDELIIKTLQLLVVKEDKSKLRVYPLNETFGVDQKKIFVAEAYNNIYERIYDQSVTLKITNEKRATKSYNFTITADNSRFEVSGLPAGIYNYEASSSILNKNETSSGQFAIVESDAETLNSKANFDLLKTLSASNNGDFVDFKNIIELRKSLDKKGLTNKVISNEELKDIINIKWLLVLIIILAALEWVLRKYFGQY